VEVPVPVLPLDMATEELIALREEIALLRRRVSSLELERDEFAQQNSGLFVLQQVFSSMNSTLEIDDILAMVLRGVHEALHFGRVVLFEVRDGVPSRRLETDPGGTVVHSPDPDALRRTPAFASMVAGTLELKEGAAEEDDSPLDDAEGIYCMVPLISRNTVRGILYVDRPPDSAISETNVQLLWDFAAQAAIAMENARLYSETKRLLEETQRLASTDPLTGLANRRALNELMERELHNAERYGAPLAFLVLDLDDLKKINDGLGHHAGDEALRSFAEILRANARRGDIVARYAGDEFVLVMAQTDRIATEAILRRIYAAMDRSELHCSAGIALFPRHGADATTLFAAADRALYEAKLAGKNRFRFAPEPA